MFFFVKIEDMANKKSFIKIHRTGPQQATLCVWGGGGVFVWVGGWVGGCVSI